LTSRHGHAVRGSQADATGEAGAAWEKGLFYFLSATAMKVPTQYMHTLYFDMRLKRKTSEDEIIEHFRKHPGLSVTYKKSANSVFAFGRAHGYMGRILNQTVLAQNTLKTLDDGKRVVGATASPRRTATVSSAASP
jgi:glyceraldehyde-3-phosphate dehydrogenase/erythrose-4-phosphate dehydrogenase